MILLSTIRVQGVPGRPFRIRLDRQPRRERDRGVGIDSKLDGEVLFDFGESGHVLYDVALRRRGLLTFRGFPQGLSCSIEEAPDVSRNAADRGHRIGDQILGDLERGLRSLRCRLRELYLRHRLQLCDRVDFCHATHEHLVAIGFKDPEIGINRVVVRAEVSRHGIPYGKVGSLEILGLQNCAGVERRQRLLGRRCGGGWRRRLHLRMERDRGREDGGGE